MKTLITLFLLVAMVASGATTNAPGIRPPTGFTPTTNAPNTNSLTGYFTNSLFVAKSGNNSTAVRGQSSRPYLTIGAAKTNAVSGDTIFVYPGTYLENDLAKNGVTIQCLGGVTISYDAEDYKAGTGKGIVDDRYTGAVNFKLLGKPDIYYCTGTNSNLVADSFDQTGTAVCSNSVGAFVITNLNSTIVLDLGKVRYDSFSLQTTLGAITVYNASNITVHADEITEPYYGRTLVTTNIDPGVGGLVSLLPAVTLVYWELGEFYLNCDHLGKCEQYAIWSQEPVGNHTNNLWFKGGLIESKMYVAGHSAEYKGWFNFFELHGTNSVSGDAITIFGGKNYITADKISDDVVGAIAVGGGSATNYNEAWITVQKISSKAEWLNVSSNCIAHVTCQQFNDTGGSTGIIAQNGSTLFLNGQTARAAGKVLDYRGGNTTVTGMELRSTNNVAVFATNNGCILQNCLLISKTTSNSIESAAFSANVGFIGGLANRPKSSNVTIQPGTLPAADTNLQ